jgi:hypothetical protein
MERNFSRRSFFKMGLASVAVVPLIARVSKSFAGEACPTSAPAGKQIASSSEGMGKNLEYVVDANASKNALHKAGDNCAKCKFYNDKLAAGGYAPCAMMGNKFVTSCGWCKSYKAKA